MYGYVFLISVKACVFHSFQTILFTTDEEILEQVSQHDQVFEADWLLEEEEVKAEEEQEEERPQTADRGDQQAQGLVS